MILLKSKFITLNEKTYEYNTGQRVNKKVAKLIMISTQDFYVKN